MRGLYASLRAYLEMYVEMHRATGRTQKLIDNAEPGDWIITGNQEEVRRIDHGVNRRGLHDVRISYAELVGDLMRKANERGPMKRGGRVLFDHFAIEAFYRSALVGVETSMDAFEKAVTRNEPTPPPGDIEVPPATADRLRGRHGL
jgi:hypothetical protein